MIKKIVLVACAIACGYIANFLGWVLWAMHHEDDSIFTEEYDALVGAYNQHGH